jgi:hypothetical protein
MIICGWCSAGAQHGIDSGELLLYRASVGMLARSSGSSFRAGLSVPTDEHVV